MTNQVLHGDCLELMKDIPDKSIDLILTDPPYNIARDNNFKTIGRAGIDFGEWDKNADIFSYIESSFRVLKNGGAFVVFSDWKKLGDIVKESEIIGFETKDMLRLEKTNPMPRNRDRRYITDYECAIWFVKPKAKWVFNRQDPMYQRPKFVHSIESGLHPTQKNTKLMESIIKIHSNEGDIVLDPFAGSGTTGVACVNTNRKYILMEQAEEYIDIIVKRLSGLSTSK